MNIGEAAAATGVSTKMIRYYEEVGVIKSALRTSAGYRVYTHPEIQTLRFVRRARDLGFSVKQISSLLKLWRDGNRASADVKKMALGHVTELEKKMRELKEMTSALRHLAENCHGDDMPDCPILHELGCIDCADPAPPKRQRALGRGFEVVR